MPSAIDRTEPLFILMSDLCVPDLAHSLYRPLLPPDKFSPIKGDMLHREVWEHSDKHFVAYVLGIPDGFHIGFNTASMSL